MTTSLFNGIISGERRRPHDEVAARAAKIAGGLDALGVGPGDCVCVLMRNEAARQMRRRPCDGRDPYAVSSRCEDGLTTFFPL